MPLFNVCFLFTTFFSYCAANNNDEIFHIGQKVVSIDPNGLNFGELEQDQAKIFKIYIVVDCKDDQIALSHKGTAKWFDKSLVMSKDDAMKKCDEQISRNPSSDTYFYKALLLTGDEDYRNAINNYTKSIELGNKDVITLTNIATCYAKLGLHRESLSFYNKAIQMKKANDLLYIFCGEEYVKLFDFNKAIDCFDSALVLNPRSDRAYADRAACNLYKGNRKSAMDDVKTALSINPNNYNAYNTRGVIAFGNNDAESSIKDFKIAASINSSDPTSHKNLGMVYKNTKQYDKAIDHYNVCISLDRKHANALNELAWILATCPDNMLRNPRRAIVLAWDACEITNWGDWNKLDTLASAYASNMEFDKAIGWEKKAISKCDNLDAIEDLANRLRLFSNKTPFTELAK